MAFDAANQVSKAMRVYIEGIYDAYQNTADFYKFFTAETEEVPVNYKGRLVSIETKANPSLAYGNIDGGDLATPGNPTLDNLTVTYQWLNAGLEQTLGAIYNNNKETVGDPLKRSVKSSAKQFNQWLNYYTSAGNGTNRLATASANYSGGTPTVMTCSGATDTFGATRVVDAQKGYIYDATGTTQRTGTVGAGILTISSHTKTAITFSSNLPSDMVSTDIFVPEGGVTTGVKGLPYIVNNTGNYFDKSRSSVTQLQSAIITASASLSTGLLLKLFAQVIQNSGREDDGDAGWLTLASALSQWFAYYQLTTTTPQSHYFNHEGTERPAIDVGGRNFQFTWFGTRIRRFLQLDGTAMYMLDMSTFKIAMLKKVGQILEGMPASDWLQAINGTTSTYRAARDMWMDAALDCYAREPFKLGALLGLDVTGLPIQRS